MEVHSPDGVSSRHYSRPNVFAGVISGPSIAEFDVFQVIVNPFSCMSSRFDIVLYVRSKGSLLTSKPFLNHHGTVFVSFPVDVVSQEKTPETNFVELLIGRIFPWNQVRTS